MSRIARIKESMTKNNVDALIVTDPSNIFYLTGKWIHPGERLLALVLRLGGGDKILINELFPVTDDLGVEKVWFKDTDDSVKILSNYLNDGETIAIDGNWRAEFLLRLMDIKKSVYKSGTYLVSNLRKIKDEKEKDFMRAASKMNDDAMNLLKSKLYVGITEKKATEVLKDIYNELGADGFSFSPIIAFGANCADPHHDTDNTALKSGDSIICDIGCTLDSYSADMTRTFFWGNISDEARKVYNTVLTANVMAENMIKPGVKFSDLDKKAREHIASMGYGEFFTHRLGHSIGIDVHEPGDVSSVNDALLEEGMVFSIEPGIYLTGNLGVRIEDLVLVTADGYELLNNYPKEITVLR